MAWFKVDDGFSTNPKVLSIPRRHRLTCLGLWVTSGAWSAKHLTDGRIPAYMLEEFGAEVSQGDMLVESGLWSAEGDAYRFKDWDEYQPKKVDVLATREKERRRKEDYRKKRAGITEESPSGTQPPEDEPSQGASEHPDPTRPDPTRPNKKESATRGSRVPKNFKISDEMRKWAATEVPLVDLDVKLPEFIDFWSGVAGAKGVKTDWVSTWRNGMRKQQEFAVRDGKKLPNPNKQRRTAADIKAHKEAVMNGGGTA